MFIIVTSYVITSNDQLDDILTMFFTGFRIMFHYDNLGAYDL